MSIFFSTIFIIILILLIMFFLFKTLIYDTQYDNKTNTNSYFVDNDFEKRDIKKEYEMHISAHIDFENSYLNAGREYLEKDRDLIIKVNGLNVEMGTYIGDTLYDLPHGKGKIIVSKRNSFEGLFEYGHPIDGEIYTVKNDGDIYIGSLSESLKDGYGEFTFANGDLYKGMFKNDYFEGYGFYKFTHGGSYIGEFKRNLYHGYGDMILPNENESGYKIKYTGYFYNGKPDRIRVENYKDEINQSKEDINDIEESLITNMKGKNKESTNNQNTLISDESLMLIAEVALMLKNKFNLLDEYFSKNIKEYTKHDEHINLLLIYDQHITYKELNKFDLAFKYLMCSVTDLINNNYSIIDEDTKNQSTDRYVTVAQSMIDKLGDNSLESSSKENQAFLGMMYTQHALLDGKINFKINGHEKKISTNKILEYIKKEEIKDLISDYENWFNLYKKEVYDVNKKYATALKFLDQQPLHRAYFDGMTVKELIEQQRELIESFDF